MSRELGPLARELSVPYYADALPAHDRFHARRVRDVSVLREWAGERLDALYTAPGRRLGRARWEFMEEFFTRFGAELGVEGSE